MPTTARWCCDASCRPSAGRAGTKTARGEIEGRLEGLGGDERARHREIELLRWQLDELVRATLDDPDEDARLSD